MQANSWQIIPLSFFPLNLESACGKEEKKLQKYEYLENEERFLGEIKIIFHSLWRAVFWWKNTK